MPAGNSTRACKPWLRRSTTAAPQRADRRFGSSASLQVLGYRLNDLPGRMEPDRGIAAAREVGSFMQLAMELFVIVVLVALNAFLAASEIAIVSARRPQMRSLADDGNRAAARVVAL